MYIFGGWVLYKGENIEILFYDCEWRCISLFFYLNLDIIEWIILVLDFQEDKKNLRLRLRVGYCVVVIGI